MGELVGKAIQAHATQNDPTKTAPAGPTTPTPVFTDPRKEMFAEAWDAAKDVHEVNKKARSEEGKKLKEVSLPAVEAPDMSRPQETTVDYSPARSEDADAKLKALMAQIQGG